MPHRRVILFLCYIILQGNAKLILTVDNIEVCGETPDSPIIFHYVRVDKSNPRMPILQVNFEVTEDIELGHTIVLVKRCANKDSLDSCMDFMKIQPYDVCKFIELPGKVWSSCFRTFSMPIRCPLKKGIYIQNNCTMDLKINIPYPIEGWNWRLKGMAYDNNNKLLVRGCGQGSVKRL